MSPSLKMGGIERSSSIIANFCTKRGYHVTFIALFRQEHFFILDSAIHFVEPEGNQNRHKINLTRTILWLNCHIKRVKPEVVLVFNYFYGALTRLALIGNGIPLFVSDRMSPQFRWPISVHIFNSLVYKVHPPTGIISQTDLAANYMRNFFGKRTEIEVIPNALRHVNLFPQIKRKNQILAVGRLNDKLKGFDRLLDAFTRIKNQEWKLVFAGGDEEGNKLKSQAKLNGVLDRIVFLGKVKDIDRVYAEAGIFVIPSRSEGFPNVLCEAMAAGLPCVSFDFIAGPKEIITNGYNGILVENNNIELLARSIDLLIENESERLRLGQNAREIIEELNENIIGKRYLDFILNKPHGKETYD